MELLDLPFVSWLYIKRECLMIQVALLHGAVRMLEAMLGEDF
jgi:hypothetical protein